MKSIFVLSSLVLFAACHTALPNSPESVSAGRLSDEYQTSREAVRGKYDGKEITVNGYAASGSILPHSEAEQGSILMYERGRDFAKPIVCWFSPQQATEFAKIRGGEYLVVKGVFNGEAAAELRFCRLLKVE